MLVAFVERVLSRRRTYAALVATGVPRSVLVRASLWHAAAPAVPAIALSTVAGVVISMIMKGLDVTASAVAFCETRAADGTCPGAPLFTRAVEVPWVHLGALGGGAVLVVLAMAALSLTFLRASTDIAELRTA